MTLRFFCHSIFINFLKSVFISKYSSDGFNNFLMMSVGFASIFRPDWFWRSINKDYDLNSWTLSSIFRFCSNLSIRPNWLNWSFKVESCTSISSSSTVLDFYLFSHLLKINYNFPDTNLFKYEILKVMKRLNQ